MTAEDLVLGNQITALIESKQTTIDLIAELFEDDSAMGTALVIVTATGHPNTTVSASASARALLEAKVDTLESEIDLLESQFAAL